MILPSTFKLISVPKTPFLDPRNGLKVSKNVLGFSLRSDVFFFQYCRTAILLCLVVFFVWLRKKRKKRSEEHFVFSVAYEVTTLKVIIEFPFIFLLFGRKSAGTGSRGDVFVVRTSKPVENLGVVY